MRPLALLAVVLLLVSVGAAPAGAQTPLQHGFPRYRPGPALRLDQRDTIGARRSVVDPAVWAGSSAGSGAGLLGGFMMGLVVSERLGIGRGGEDPGLGVGLLGALVGTTVGNALGGEIGASMAGRPPVPFGRRLMAAAAGTMAGGLAVHLAGRTGDLGEGGALVTYSLASGLLATLVSAPPR